MTTFTDAQEMAIQHPETFFAPSKEELDNIQEGDFVKVCAHPERFWIEVRKVNGNDISGVIDNDLICDEHGLSEGQAVSVEKRHVYNILKKS